MTSSDTTITMAFVTGTKTDRIRDAGIARDSGFKVVDMRSGAEIPSQERTADAVEWSAVVDPVVNYLRVWDVTIPAGEAKLLEITYQVLCGGDQHSSAFKYHARPAALWADDIQMARFSFSFGSLGGPLLRCLLKHNDCVTMEIVPPGYTWGPHGIE
jgi:hypothetical protein